MADNRPKVLQATNLSVKADTNPKDPLIMIGLQAGDVVHVAGLRPRDALEYIQALQKQYDIIMNAIDEMSRTKEDLDADDKNNYKDF